MATVTEKSAGRITGIYRLNLNFGNLGIGQMNKWSAAAKAYFKKICKSRQFGRTKEDLSFPGKSTIMETFDPDVPKKHRKMTREFMRSRLCFAQFKQDKRPGEHSKRNDEIRRKVQRLRDKGATIQEACEKVANEDGHLSHYGVHSIVYRRSWLKK